MVFSVRLLCVLILLNSRLVLFLVGNLKWNSVVWLVGVIVVDRLLLKCMLYWYGCVCLLLWEKVSVCLVWLVMGMLCVVEGIIWKVWWLFIYGLG